jgi:hypothetical protein
MNIGGAPVLHLVVGDATVHAEARRGNRAVWAGAAEYATYDDLEEVIARLAAAPAERCRRLRVILRCPPARARILSDLPPVRERELASLVANQAGRFFRRNGAPLVTDATWVPNGTGRVTQAAAAEEPLVLAILAGAAEAGLHVDSIAVDGMSPDLQLLPTVERAARVRGQRRAVARLAIAVCAAWIVAAGLLGIRLVIERRAVDSQLSAAESPLAALRDVRHEMRLAEAMVVTLTAARRTRGEALATLARLNAAVPDSAVLTSYTWRSDRSGVLTGAGRRAADVLSAVDRSDAVSDARLEGPTVREAIGGREWERFTISFGPRAGAP